MRPSLWRPGNNFSSRWMEGGDSSGGGGDSVYCLKMELFEGVPVQGTSPRSPARVILWGVLLLVGVAAVVAAVWIFRPRRGGMEEGLSIPPPAAARSAAEEAIRLLEERRFPEARERLRGVLEAVPQDGVLNLLMGRCLREMAYFESSVPFWKAARDRFPPAREECDLNLGLALFRMGHAVEALPFLKKNLQQPDLEAGRRLALAECCLELERYEEALRILEGAPSGGGVSWIRHRALSYLDRADEARREVEALPESQSLMRAILEISLARESGDFESAGRSLQAALSRVGDGTSDWARLKRSEIALRIEAGDTVALDRVTDELVGVSEAHVAGVALWGRAIARLLVGKKEEAVAAAGEFLAGVNPEFTPLRMERLMMLHLAGRIADEALEAEIPSLSRTWQNDLLYYLALVRGGDRRLAERALQATPGRNFPYHAIRRLLP